MRRTIRIVFRTISETHTVEASAWPQDSGAFPIIGRGGNAREALVALRRNMRRHNHSMRVAAVYSRSW